MTAALEGNNFLETMLTAGRYCSTVAIGLQADVVNIGKAVGRRDGDSFRLMEKRRAKTTADIIIQDVLYQAGTISLGRDIFVDAEETSALIPKWAHSVDSEKCLILDPIDGTLEYIEGRNNYSICVGWRHSGEIIRAIVLFPARDTAYFFDGTASYIVKNYLTDGFENRTRLSHPKRNCSHVIYINKRVPQELVKELGVSGFEVVDDEFEDIGAPDAILKSLVGESICYLSYTRQVRDILLGVILGGIEGGYALDWNGRELKWPRSKRLPRGIFGCGKLPGRLVELTSKFSVPV